LDNCALDYPLNIVLIISHLTLKYCWISLLDSLIIKDLDEPVKFDNFKSARGFMSLSCAFEDSWGWDWTISDFQDPKVLKQIFLKIILLQETCWKCSNYFYFHTCLQYVYGKSKEMWMSRWDTSYIFEVEEGLYTFNTD